jgi:ribosome-associated translation inhibitor RaiA
VTISLAVKSSFEYSAALAAHIERRIDHALRTHVGYIRRVELRLSDANGPRHGASDKVVRVDVSLNPTGRIVATAASDDVYVSVSRAASRAKTAVARQIQQLEQRGRREARAERRGVMTS